jgi:hypothetical protein
MERFLALIRKSPHREWWLLFAIAAGAVLAILAVKLIALVAASFDISFLRSVSTQTGAAGAGAGGGGRSRCRCGEGTE